MDEFDKYFRRAHRTFWVVFITQMIVGLIILGGIIFVAVHFLKMFW